MVTKKYRSGYCAAPLAKQVIGVERNPAAVKDAAANARRNKIANARFVCADATEWMAAAAGEGLHPDVVFLDPPRAGSTPECIAAVNKMKPRRVVYVSCDPEPSCSGFVCDNAKLRDYIASKADAPTAAQYKENISKIREAKASGNDKGVVMKKEEMNQTTEEQTNTLSNVAVGIAVIIVLLALILFVRKRRKSSQM